MPDSNEITTQLKSKTPKKYNFSPRETCINIACRLLNDLAQYLIGSDLQELQINFTETPEMSGRPNYFHFTVCFQKQSHLDKLADAINNVDPNNMGEEFIGKRNKLSVNDNDLTFSVEHIDDVATFVRHLTEANLNTARLLKPIEKVSDLKDVDLALLWAQLALPEKNLVDFYNDHLNSLWSTIYADFTYSPEDLDNAIGAYAKSKHGLKEIPSCRILYIH